MIIGMDFDNTIVCYDALFHKIAVERKLIPRDLAASKEKIRDYLRRNGQEDAWTELQGYVYGSRMNEAVPFPGVVEFLSQCRNQGIEVHIISHRTQRPFRGPDYDLHQAAQQWLVKNGFFDERRIGLPAERAHLELTKEAKFNRIAEVGCTHFIDDLAEFLQDPKFPKGVQRVLFDPYGNGSGNEGLSRASSWKEVEKIILAGAPEPSKDAVRKLLLAVGWRGEFTLNPLKGAANNRVFQVDAGGNRYLLKAYFRHPQDPRDRLGAEFAFSQFAWNHNVRALPRPIASDPADAIALYEFVEGHRPRQEEVTQDAVNQALEFYLDLNRHKDEPQARALPPASEACFSIVQHLDCTQRRLDNLLRMNASSPIDAEAANFVRGSLSQAWNFVVDLVQRDIKESGMSLENEVPAKDRRLSPSDFGFHNALLTSEGRIRFIDFEYAGWDDPAKMTCDFFCQQEVPVSENFFPGFVDTVVKDLSKPEAHRRRIALLLPIYRIKWCCILLNDFLSVGMARRQFAQGDLSFQNQKTRQLRKAKLFLKALQQR